MSHRTSSRHLQDGLIAGQSWAHQWGWWHSVITCLRKGNNDMLQMWKRGLRRCERNNSADTKVREKGGEERSKCQSRHSRAAYGEGYGDVGSLPAAHGGLWWSRYQILQPMKDPVLQQVDMSWRKLQTVERSQHSSTLLAGTVARGGPKMEQSIPEVLYPV